MVHAYHAIFSMYGFWLPNDPRGSWSDEVWAKDLRQFGSATKVSTHASLAHRPHDREARLAAKAALKYPPVSLTGVQARAASHGFAEIAQKLGLSVWARAILPDHVHMVVARHREKIESLVGFLKRAATRAMSDEGVNPMDRYRDAQGRAPSLWGQRGWCRFLDHERAIRDAIAYVERNPVKAGLPAQRWRLVQAFAGLPV